MRKLPVNVHDRDQWLIVKANCGFLKKSAKTGRRQLELTGV